MLNKNQVIYRANIAVLWDVKFMHFGLLVPNLRIKVARCLDVLLPPTKLHYVIRGRRYENFKSQTFLCLFFEVSW
jgi:hypothetical protein